MIEALKTNRKLTLFLLMSNFLYYFGSQIWRALFNNFAVEKVGAGPIDIGWIQSLREIPGLLGFTLGFLVLLLSEKRIVILSLLFIGVGILLTGFSQTVPFLLFSTMIFSIGFHFFYSCNNSLVLMSFNKQQTPGFLGQLRGLGAVTAILATGAVYLLAETLGYRIIFTAVGILVLVGGLLLLPSGKGTEGIPSKRKKILRKRYWLYYTLSFLIGCRRHIFTTFAIFLLVHTYGINVKTAALLFLINHIVNSYALPLVGRLVSRVGERSVLTVSFTVLIAIFLGYAFISYLPVLYILFVLNNLMFGCDGLALPSYFQKIALSQEEITGNVSAEQTINHIAAIAVPVLGGTIWELLGFQAPFLFGASIVFVALVLTQWIRIPIKVAATNA
jgi:predicted MFS family arabinose efflux permease